MRISRWGNSLAVRIPRDLAHRVRLEEGSEVEISIEDEAIKIRARRGEERLEDLVAGISDANRHDETDWGEPRGGEIW